MYDFSSLSFFLSFFLSFEKSKKSLSRHRQSSRATRRKKTADDLNDGETCVIRVAVSFRAFRFFFLSFSLSLCPRSIYARFFCALFSFVFWVAFAVWVSTGGCDVGLREGRKRAQKRASRRRVWTRIDENARKKSGARGFRAERRAEEGRTRVRVRVRATDFLVLGGPVSRGPRNET